MDKKEENMIPDDERIVIGCVGSLIQLFVIILLCVIMAVVCSCATTHKVGTNVIHEKADSLSTLSVDSTLVSMQTTDSVGTLHVDEGHIQHITTDTETNTEVITERIVEVIDTTGNRIITTDRTTNRKNSTLLQTITDEQWNKRDEDMHVISNRLDSMNNVLQSMCNVHVERDDSTHRDDTSTPVMATGILAARAIVLIALGIASLLLILYKVVHDKRKGNGQT